MPRYFFDVATGARRICDVVVRDETGTIAERCTTHLAAAVDPG